MPAQLTCLVSYLLASFESPEAVVQLLSVVLVVLEPQISWSQQRAGLQVCCGCNTQCGRCRLDLFGRTPPQTQTSLSMESAARDEAGFASRWGKMAKHEPADQAQSTTAHSGKCAVTTAVNCNGTTLCSTEQQLASFPAKCQVGKMTELSSARFYTRQVCACHVIVCGRVMRQKTQYCKKLLATFCKQLSKYCILMLTIVYGQVLLLQIA